MKIGIRIPSAGPLRDVVQTARRAEAAGLDMAWFSDSPLNYREVWSVLGAVSISTERIAIGPAVTNLASRHITVTAAAARTIMEVAPGRFMLGIGAGDSAVGFDTLKPATVAQMEKGVEDLRRLTAGQPVKFGAFEAHLRDAHAAPPILIAASGPKTMAMAGRVADGVIITMGDIETKAAQIAEAARGAGRPMPAIYCAGTCGLIQNEEEAMRAMKVYCMRIAQLEGTAAFEKAGFKIEGEFLSHKMGAQGDIGHAASVADLARQMDKIISDDVARWYMKNRVLMGTVKDIENGLHRLAKSKITGIYLTSPEASTLPNSLIDLLGPIVRDFRLAA